MKQPTNKHTNQKTVKEKKPKKPTALVLLDIINPEDIQLSEDIITEDIPVELLEDITLEDTLLTKLETEDAKPEEAKPEDISLDPYEFPSYPNEAPEKTRRINKNIADINDFFERVKGKPNPGEDAINEMYDLFERCMGPIKRDPSCGLCVLSTSKRLRTYVERMTNPNFRN